MKHVVEPGNIGNVRIKAFFTTKHFSTDNENMSDALSRELNISTQDIYLPVQQHTDNVHIFSGEKERAVADAVITVRREVLIGVIVADCVPVLLYDPSQKIIAAVHAGWKGTADGILKKTLDRMASDFHCRKEDILIAIGPSIRKCSYEVGADVKEAVEKETGKGDYVIMTHNTYQIDLSTANRVQATSSGVPDINIWQSEECTYCNPLRYHSYRYSGEKAGRQGGFIGMW